ncbi:FimV family protein, partial [Oleiphilus sp. HI0125]
PVREPFINFLVEVIWPSGRLLREYALLIDPPVFAEDKPVVASPAASQQAKPQVSAPASVEKGDNLAVRSSVKPKAGALAGNETYGPTKSTDTLWDIATGIRPDRNVSPQQVMLAIQDLNPDAFIDGNINKMKAGQILRLPTRDQMTSRSAYQAINSVIEQNAALRKPKTKTPTSSSKPSTQSSPKTQKPAANQDQLKLVVPDKDSKASDSAGSDPQGSNATGVSQGEMNIALEQLDKANLENEELSGKVDALEEQLETLQRILTLKNDQLASLQSQMRASELDAAQAEVDGEQGASQESVEETAEVAEVIVEQVKETVVLDEDGSVIAEQVEVTEVVAEIQVEEVKPAEAAPAEAPAPVNFQEDLLNKLMTNPLYQAGVAGILILLLIALWLISKSRAKQESDDYEEEYEPVESDEPTELESADEELEEPAAVVKEEAEEESVEEDAPASPEEDVIA